MARCSTPPLSAGEGKVTEQSVYSLRCPNCTDFKGKYRPSSTALLNCIILFHHCTFWSGHDPHYRGALLVSSTLTPPRPLPASPPLSMSSCAFFIGRIFERSSIDRTVRLAVLRIVDGLPGAVNESRFMPIRRRLANRIGF